METHKVLLIFNKFSGKYLSMVPNGMIKSESLKHEHYLYKEVEMNTDEQRWEGNFEEGSLVSINDESDLKPETIDEYQVNAMATKKIKKVYPDHRQLNLMVRVLDDMLGQLDISETESIIEFKDMIEYIGHIRENNKRYKKMYAASPYYNYLSKEDVKRQFEEEIAGGLRKVIPKNLLEVRGNPFYEG